MTLSLLPSDFSRRNQRLIICFTSAGSKKELLAAAAQAPRDIAAGPFQPLGSPLPQKYKPEGLPYSSCKYGSIACSAALLNFVVAA